MLALKHYYVIIAISSGDFSNCCKYLHNSYLLAEGYKKEVISKISARSSTRM